MKNHKRNGERYMNEIEKLRVLVPHWIEHNAEHAHEFRIWAERAKKAGQDRL